MLEIQRTSIDVKIDGITYKLRMPSFLESSKYRKDLELMDSAEKQTDLLMSYLDSLGIPKNVVGSLDPDSIDPILEFVRGGKKK